MIKKKVQETCYICKQPDSVKNLVYVRLPSGHVGHAHPHHKGVDLVVFSEEANES